MATSLILFSAICNSQTKSNGPAPSFTPLLLEHWTRHGLYVPNTVIQARSPQCLDTRPYPTKQTKSFESSLFFFFLFFILPPFWIFLNHFFLLFKLFLFSNLVVLTNECRILEAVVQSTKATVSCSDSSYLFFCFLVFILFFICRLSLRLLRLSHYRLQAQPVAATKK